MSDGVLIVAHGSRDPRSAPVALGVASRLAERKPARPVAACFLELCDPTPEQALAQLGAVSTLAVVPFLLSRAYHAGVDVPKVVDHARAYAAEVRLADVLGPDPRLVNALVARLAARLARAEVDVDAVVLASAGSSHPAANAGVQQVANDLATRLAVPVSVAYASAADPTVAEAVAEARRARGTRVAVATYLLAPGYFGDRIAASARQAGAAVVTEPIGASDPIVDLVADRARRVLDTPRIGAEV